MGIIEPICTGLVLAAIAFLAFLFGREQVLDWREKQANLRDSKRQAEQAREAGRLITQALCVVAGEVVMPEEMNEDFADWWYELERYAGTKYDYADAWCLWLLACRVNDIRQVEAS